MFDKELFLKNVFSIAEQKGMSINALEKEIDVSAGYLAKLRKDDTRKNITADLMIKLSDVLGVSIDSLCKTDCNLLTKDELDVMMFFEKIKKNTLNNKCKWEQEDADFIQAGQGVIGWACTESSEFGHTCYNSLFRANAMPIGQSYSVKIKENVFFAIIQVFTESVRDTDLESYIIQLTDKSCEAYKICASYDNKSNSIGLALQDLYKIAEASGKKISLDSKTSKLITDFIRSEDNTSRKGIKI